MMQKNTNNYIDAIKAIKQAILQSRYRVAALANSEMLSLYFSVGEYISRNSRKSFWGTNAIEKISNNLQRELPGLRGFSATNMRYMRLFYEAYSVADKSSLTSDKIQSNSNQYDTNHQLSTDEIVIHPLVTDEIHQLQVINLNTTEIQYFIKVGFTHHREILSKAKSLEERLFYIQRCATEFWTVDKLKYNLKANLFGQQGTIINNFVNTISEKDFRGKALWAFKDEYLLNFVNIEDPDEEDEREIENQIVLNIKKFIMALGTDFTFIGNQHRLVVDGREFFVDLLFFNRQIQSLVAIDLKKRDFKPEYAGKMNFYLSALDDLERKPHENPSIGIILCKEKSNRIVEYAFRDTSKPMGVATYLTARELPPEYKGILPDIEELKNLMEE